MEGKPLHPFLNRYMATQIGVVRFVAYRRVAELKDINRIEYS